MAYLALIVGKLLNFALGLLNRGSSLPGKIALNIQQDLLSRFKFPEEVIVITGTNGKTSTTHLIANIMKEDGRRVMTNAAGANLAQGIVTQALKHASFNFKIKADTVVLEVDEATLPRVIADINPKYLVLLNLFPDQEDRFGSVEDLAKLLNNSLIDDLHLIINANDPRLTWIGKNYPHLEKKYFGLEKEEFNQPHHAVECMECGEMLTYIHHHYEHTGYYECPNGCIQTPEIDYLAYDINIDQGTFKIEDTLLRNPQDTLYSVFNTTAAIAVSREAGVLMTTIEETLSEIETVRGRNEVVRVRDKDIRFTLAKNPAGMNQTITYLEREMDDDFNILIAINNQKADGESISWLNDCVFDRLNNDHLQKVFVAGSVRDDLADILVSKGISKDKISFENERVALEALTSLPDTAYVIANYTAMTEVYKAVNELK